MKAQASSEFDEELSRALGLAYESHKTSGDSVDINTEALLFGLSQVEPTRSLLPGGTRSDGFREFRKKGLGSISAPPSPLSPKSLQELNVSTSVVSILGSAAEAAQKMGHEVISPAPVLLESIDLHPEILTGLGIDPDSVRGAVRRFLEAFVARGFADTETPEDHLNRSVYARALAGLMGVPSTTTPMAIGIYGPWGQGKSSFMLRMEQELESLHHSKEGILPCVPVRFNAWRFDEKDKVWAALMAEIHDVYKDKVRFWKRVWRHLLSRPWTSPRFLANAVLFVSAVGIGLVILLSGDEEVRESPWLRAVGSLFGLAGLPLAWQFAADVLLPAGRRLNRYLRKPGYREKLGFQQYVFEDFQEKLNVLLGRPDYHGRRDGRLVVFIDDLDRCSPESVVEVLESLRLFLSENGVVTVLGLDEEFVSLAIADRYSHVAGRDESPQTRLQFGRSYLEKLIQLPVYIQDPSDSELLPLALEMVRSPGPEQTAEKRTTPEEQETEGAESGGPSDLPAVEANQKTKRAGKLKALEFDDRVSQILDELRVGLPANPRKLKRVFNTYRLLHYLVETDGGHFDPKATLAWLLLRQDPDPVVIAIEQAVRRQGEPQQKKLGDLSELRADELAAWDGSGREGNAENDGVDRLTLVRAIYDQPVGTIASIARHAAWFCVPSGLRIRPADHSHDRSQA